MMTAVTRLTSCLHIARPPAGNVSAVAVFTVNFISSLGQSTNSRHVTLVTRTGNNSTKFGDLTASESSSVMAHCMAELHKGRSVKTFTSWSRNIRPAACYLNLLRSSILGYKQQLINGHTTICCSRDLDLDLDLRYFNCFKSFVRVSHVSTKLEDRRPMTIRLSVMAHLAPELCDISKP